MYLWVMVSGAYNPVHNQHLQMFDEARAALATQGFDVIQAYMCPSHDEYLQSKFAGMTSPLSVTSPLAPLFFFFDTYFCTRASSCTTGATTTSSRNTCATRSSPNTCTKSEWAIDRETLRLLLAIYAKHNRDFIVITGHGINVHYRRSIGSPYVASQVPV
jgi:hypothetical protein